MLFVAEIFGDGEAGEADAETRAGRLGHLAIDQSGAGLFRISWNDDAGFLKFQPKVVSFAGTLADASEHGNAAMLHGDVVDQFLNENGFTDACAAEQPDFSALQEGLDQVDDLDAGLKHFESGGLIREQWRGAMNGIVGLARQRAELIHGFAEHVHHTAQSRTPNGNGNASTSVVRFHATNQTFRWLHGDTADAALAEVLLHFGGYVDRFRDAESFAGDANRVVNGGQVPGFKLDVEHGSNDLHDVSDGGMLVCHTFLLNPAM
jgi:hypothetical protein